VKEFRKSAAPQLGWLARRRGHLRPPCRHFGDLSHVKAAVAVLVLFAAEGGHTERQAQAKSMKNQGELSNSNVTVIVIGDDLAVRNSLKFWFEIEGLTVRSYATGAELLNAGDLARCDCYVIDQKIPATSGLDLIAQLRDQHFTAPAILIASHPGLSLRERAEKAEVPIVEKPLLGNGLLDKIRDVIGSRHG
jgi:CheY-like chemotaxis protein